MTEIGGGETWGENERQEEIKKGGNPDGEKERGERRRGLRLQTTNRDLMRIWKVFSPASLPKPLGQPSLHSFHPRLSFQLLKRSERKRENKKERSAQRPPPPCCFCGGRSCWSSFPSSDPYPRVDTPLVSENITLTTHWVCISLCKCTPILISVHTHTLCDI